MGPPSPSVDLALPRRPSPEGGRHVDQPAYIFDIEVHHRIPARHVLRELARVLELEYDALLALTGASDTVVRAYLAVHPQHTKAIITLFRATQQREFHDWDQIAPAPRSWKRARLLALCGTAGRGSEASVDRPMIV